MSGKMSISASGGSITIGQVVQSDRVLMHGNVQLRISVALEEFRADVHREAVSRNLGLNERTALEERIAGLEAAIIAAADDSGPTPLQRIRILVEDFKGAFGWASPILKTLLASVPPLAELL